MSKEIRELHLNNSFRILSGEGLPIQAPDSLVERTDGQRRDLEVRCTRPFELESVGDRYSVIENILPNAEPGQDEIVEVRPVGNLTTAYMAVVESYDGDDVVLRRMSSDHSNGALTWRFKGEHYSQGANALALITSMRGLIPFSLSTINTEGEFLEKIRPVTKKRTSKIERDLKADIDAKVALDNLPIYMAFQASF